MYGFGGLGEVEVEIWSDVTIAGRMDGQKGKIGLLSQWTMDGWDEQLGNISPMYMIGARIKVRETVSAALVDGNAGFGAVVGQFSMELAMQKASMCNYNGKQGQ